MDETIIQRIAEKDLHALEDLYNHYERVTFNLANQLLQDLELAEETIHHLFREIWHSKGQILQADKRLAPQMLRLTREISRTFQRKPTSR